MTYTEDEVRQMVRERGSQVAFADEAGVSRQMVSMFLLGKVRPGGKILAALGLQKVYAKINACTTENGDL